MRATKSKPLLAVVPLHLTHYAGKWHISVADLVSALSSYRDEVVLPCVHCGEPFMATRTDALYCSPKCRIGAFRQRRRASNEAATHVPGIT